MDDAKTVASVLAIRGGVLQGRVVTAEEVETLAALPPIEILRGQVLGAIIAPVTALLGLVTAPLQNLYGLLDARIEQLGWNVLRIPVSWSSNETGAGRPPYVSYA